MHTTRLLPASAPLPLLLPLLLLAPTASPALAQGPASPDSAAGRPALLRAAEGAVSLAERVLEALTVERPSWSLALYPAASYSGRSGLALGVMPMLHVSSPRLPRPATVTPAVLVSTKGMFEVQCDADVYLPRRVDLTAKVEAYRQPDDLYAPGGGSGKRPLARYDFSRQSAQVEALKGLGPDGPWRVGLGLDFDRYSFSSVAPASEAEAEAAARLASSGSGPNFGLGAVGGYDSRDDALWPSAGAYVRLKAMGYAKIGGRGHDFCSLSLDARRYAGLGGGRSVLALQVCAETRLGRAPYTKMATFGGTRLGRAVGHNLKYVDRGAWLAQAELRFPLFWRLGATLFGGAGNVAHKWRDAARGVHLMCGGGLRLAVFKGKKLNMRLDGGISSRGDRAVYLNIREAF